MNQEMAPAGHSPSILLVDDNHESLEAMKKIFEDFAASIFTAKSGTEALSLLLRNEFAVAIIDTHMPDMDGYELAKMMREYDETKYTPIVFMTAVDKNSDDIYKGYEAGCVDYLFKPLDTHVVKSKMNVFLDLYNQKKALLALLDEFRHLTHTAEEMIERSTTEFKPRILLVDDKEENLFSLEKLLLNLPLSLDKVSSGEEAVAAAAQTDYAVVLLDVQMPVMDGFAAASSIRRFRDARA